MRSAALISSFVYSASSLSVMHANFDTVTPLSCKQSELCLKGAVEPQDSAQDRSEHSGFIRHAYQKQ